MFSSGAMDIFFRPRGVRLISPARAVPRPATTRAPRRVNYGHAAAADYGQKLSRFIAAGRWGVLL